MQKILKIYLSGPMYLGEDQARTWRNDFTSILRSTSDEVINFKIYDPCERFYDDKEFLKENRRWIISMDQKEIADSDIIVVNASNPAWGTPMEQYIGFTTGKLVFTFSSLRYPSIWAIEYSHRMFNSYEDVAWFINNYSTELSSNKESSILCRI